GELTRDNAAVMRIPEKRMVMSAPGKRRLRVDGADANDRLCYTTLSQFLERAEHAELRPSLAPDAADRAGGDAAGDLRRHDARVRDGAGRRAHRPAGHHGYADRRARVRLAGSDRQHRGGTDPAGAAADQPVRIALARSGPGRAEPVELRAGPAGFLAWFRCAGELRRAGDTPLSGRHSGDDARWAGP